MAAEPRHIEVSNEMSIVAARQAARQAAIAIGFGSMDQSRITTAVSELARNVLRYATGSRGDVTIAELQSDAGKKGVEVVVTDYGPGIPDVERAMEQGFSSGSGLGLGLGGAKRLMDEMTIESSPAGTTVVIRKWLK